MRGWRWHAILFQLPARHLSFSMPIASHVDAVGRGAGQILPKTASHADAVGTKTTHLWTSLFERASRTYHMAHGCQHQPFRSLDLSTAPKTNQRPTIGLGATASVCRLLNYSVDSEHFLDGFLQVFSSDDSSPDQISQLYYRIFISLLSPLNLDARIEGMQQMPYNHQILSLAFFSQKANNHLRQVRWSQIPHTAR